MERDVDADGAVLTPRDVAKLLDCCGVADGREADRFGPLRKACRRTGRAATLPDRMTRVGRDCDRDPEARRRRDLLQAVVPLSVLARRWRRVDVEVIQMLLDDRLLSPAHDGAVSLDGGGRMEHQPCLLLERHPSDEILDALAYRDRCVPVRGDGRHQETATVGSDRPSTGAQAVTDEVSVMDFAVGLDWRADEAHACERVREAFRQAPATSICQGLTR